MEKIKSEKYQRKSLLIDPKMQLKYVGMVVGIFVCISLYLTWDVYLFFDDIAGNSAAANNAEMFRVLLVIGGKIIIFSLIFAYLTLYITNRIAGPSHRISKVIRAMADSADLTQRIGLRERDELQDVATSLNKLVDMFQERLIADDAFCDKAMTISRAMVEVLQNKKEMNEEERNTLIKAGTMLLQEGAQPHMNFKYK